MLKLEVIDNLSEEEIAELLAFMMAYLLRLETEIVVGKYQEKGHFSFFYIDLVINKIRFVFEAQFVPRKLLESVFIQYEKVMIDYDETIKMPSSNGNSLLKDFFY